MFITMLAAFTGPRKPVNFQILLIDLKVIFQFISHRHCNSRRMNTSPSFCRGDTLNSMTTDLIVYAIITVVNL